MPTLFADELTDAQWQELALREEDEISKRGVCTHRGYNYYQHGLCCPRCGFQMLTLGEQKT